MSQKQQKISRMIEIINAETKKQVEKINEEAVLQANHDANKIQVELAKKAEQEFSKQEKYVEIESYVRHSQCITSLRMKVLLSSDYVMQHCKYEAFKRASALCDAATCARLVRYCCDELQITSCIVQCSRGLFEQIKQQISGLDLACDEQELPAELGGGVICFTQDRRTFIDNTIRKRVDLACQTNAPRLSGLLFDTDVSSLW